MREYEPVTKIFPLYTRGCVSCPRCFSPPNENVQTGTSSPTLEILIALSGLNRWPDWPMPTVNTLAGEFASSAIISSVTCERASCGASTSIHTHAAAPAYHEFFKFLLNFADMPPPKLAILL